MVSREHILEKARALAKSDQVYVAEMLTAGTVWSCIGWVSARWL